MVMWNSEQCFQTLEEVPPPLLPPSSRLLEIWTARFRYLIVHVSKTQQCQCYLYDLTQYMAMAHF